MTGKLGLFSGRVGWGVRPQAAYSRKKGLILRLIPLESLATNIVIEKKSLYASYSSLHLSWTNTIIHLLLSLVFSKILSSNSLFFKEPELASLLCALLQIFHILFIHFSGTFSPIHFRYAGFPSSICCNVNNLV